MGAVVTDHFTTNHKKAKHGVIKKHQEVRVISGKSHDYEKVLPEAQFLSVHNTCYSFMGKHHSKQHATPVNSKVSNNTTDASPENTTEVPSILTSQEKDLLQGCLEDNIFQKDFISFTQ